MKKAVILFTLFISYSSCHTQNVDVKEQKHVEVEQPTKDIVLNYNVFEERQDEKDILRLWRELLSKDFLIVNAENQNYWLTSDRFFAPNRFLTDLNSVKADAKSKITVIALFPISKDTLVLKTMFTTYDSRKDIQLQYIYSVYAIRTHQGFKFMSLPQWYYQNWENKQIGSITYCFDKLRPFNEKLAIRLDSFNHSMSQLFKSELKLPLYFVGKNAFESSQIMGYDFNAPQATFSQEGAYTEPNQNIIFAGNGTEYYAHEVVHLYTHQFWGKDDFYYHQWFNEGIATLFGGYQSQPLEWHLKIMKKYLDENPKEPLNDISKFYFTINNEYRTNFMYEIGGLICKLVYQKEGMNGLFDLLKSGYTDDDFYKAIEKHLNVKKENFGTFIRNELKNY